MKKALVILIVLAVAVFPTIALGQGSVAGGSGGTGGGSSTTTVTTGPGGTSTTTVTTGVVGIRCPARGLSLPGPGVQMMQPGRVMCERIEGINLTDDQKDKLGKLQMKSAATLEPLTQKAEAATKALRNAVLGPTYDAAQAAKLLADAQKADAAVSNAELPLWAEIRGILNADQMAKVKESMEPHVGFGGSGGNSSGFMRGNSGNNGGQPPAPAGR